jgi:hypothetical protein
MESKKKINRKNHDLWTDECEKLLAEWSEKASCYRWLHGRCEKSYQRWYYCFSIPVIILSTLTGAANVGMDSFVPDESKSMASAIVGGVNIFAGIISTLQNFLKMAELMEAHRIAGVSWGKLQRNIAIELALDPRRRVIQSDFLKLSRAEYDRLIEAGPMIDDGIIKQFNQKFKNYQVSVPSICNGLDKCNIYKVDPKLEIDHDEFMDGIEDIVSLEEKKLMLKHDKKIDQELEIIEKDLKNKDTDIKEDLQEEIQDKEEEDKEELQDKEEETLIPEDKKKKVEVIINVNDSDDSEQTNENITEFLDSIDDSKK